MKLLNKIFVVSAYPPSRARLSEYMHILCREWGKLGYTDVVVLADGREFRYETETRSLDYPEILRAWSFNNIFSLINILYLCLKHKPKLVHFNIHFQSFGKSRIVNFAGFTLIPVLRLLGFKVVVTIHNIGEIVDLDKLKMKNSLLNRIGILLATKMLLKATHIVVTVRKYKAYLKAKYGSKNISYIPHGATPKANGTGSLQKKDYCLLFFGHISPYKGLDVMLKAFSRLRRRIDNVKLIVAGSDHPNFPGYLNQFKTRGYPDVFFTGYIPDKRLDEIFRKADIVVLPYKITTGTSGVFHLACGYGKPIVASDTPEIRELIEDGASALLCPPEDEAALEEAVERLLKDEKLRTEMARRNSLYAEKVSMERVAKMYIELYRKIEEQS